MEERNTRELERSRSFEERMFSRFDAMDRRFDALDSRLFWLEDNENRRRLETKPSLEPVYLAIAELTERVNSGFIEMSQKFLLVNERLDGVDERLNGVEQRLEGMDKRFDGVDERFVSFSAEVSQGLRKTARR